MSQVADILQRFAELTDSRQAKILRDIDIGDDGLTPQQSFFVDEYTVDFNRRRAAEAVGMRKAPSLDPYKNPELVLGIIRKREEREKVSELKAEYIRQYLLDILELCPTDHFVLAPDGSWMIDPADFALLPHEVKRLVDSIEHKRVGGQLVCTVKFVSKAAALAMAAKFTLVEKHSLEVTALPWDQVVGKLEKEAEDPIALRLAEYGGAGRNGQSS